MTALSIDDHALCKLRPSFRGRPKAGARNPDARAVIGPSDPGLWVPGSPLRGAPERRCAWGAGLDDTARIDDVCGHPSRRSRALARELLRMRAVAGGGASTISGLILRSMCA